MRSVTFTVKVTNAEQKTVKGHFHMWGSESVGVESRELGESVATDTYAVIEDAEGCIHMVRPERVKFDSPIATKGLDWPICQPWATPKIDAPAIKVVISKPNEQ